MYKKARESFTMQDIESILNKFEIYSNERLSKKDYLVFPTVCHHSLSDKASYKLYYYNDTKMFKCYTHCDEAFDIFDLIKRIYENNYYSISMTQAYKIATGQDVEKKEDNKFKIDFSYNSYKKTNKNDNVKKEIEVYDKTVLKAFSDYKAKEWINEGISEKTMEVFNIKYYLLKNQIVIPYFNIDSKLIGIRVRNLDEGYAKYMPLVFQGKYYTFSMSDTLYGIYENKENIKKCKTAVLFEGEKSVLKMYSNNDYTALAVGGSTIHDKHIKLLQKLGVKNVILAFDKEFEKNSSIRSDNYYKILKGKANKLKHFFRTSFIYDFNNELSYKDAPIDKGYDTYQKLIKNRIHL